LFKNKNTFLHVSFDNESVHWIQIKNGMVEILSIHDGDDEENGCEVNGIL